MRFFNTKEEVIDIQLTPYGKHLLSKGKWKPVYYEFYDDDIIYDSEYGGLQERQEEIIPRIKDTKRVKTQHTFVSPATGSQLTEEKWIEKRGSLFTNFLPLGKSSAIDNKNPSISIRAHQTEMTKLDSSVGISGLPNNIYTISLEEKQYIKKIENYSEQPEPIDVQRVYSDDTFIQITEDDLLIELQEHGTDEEGEKFEISIIEIDDNDNEIKTLFFVDEQSPTKVVDNILIDNEDYQKFIEASDNGDFDKSNFINHFLEVRTDKEIDENVLCKYLDKEEILRLKIVEGYDISCVEDADVTTILSINSANLVTEET